MLRSCVLVAFQFWAVLRLYSFFPPNDNLDQHYEECWPIGIVPTGRVPLQLSKLPFKDLTAAFTLYSHKVHAASLATAFLQMTIQEKIAFLYEITFYVSLMTCIPTQLSFIYTRFYMFYNDLYNRSGGKIKSLLVFEICQKHLYQLSDVFILLHISPYLDSPQAVSISLYFPTI